MKTIIKYLRIMSIMALILIETPRIYGMDQHDTHTNKILKTPIADMPKKERYDYAVRLAAFRNILLQKYPRHLGTHTKPHVLPLRQTPVNVLQPALLPSVHSLKSEYPTSIRQKNIKSTEGRVGKKTKNRSTKQGRSKKQKKKRRNRYK